MGVWSYGSEGQGRWEDGGNVQAPRAASPSPWLPSRLGAPQDPECQQDPADGGRKDEGVSSQAQLLPLPVFLGVSVCAHICTFEHTQAQSQKPTHRWRQPGQLNQLKC